jgi:hypothetical protein
MSLLKRLFVGRARPTYTALSRASDPASSGEATLHQSQIMLCLGMLRDSQQVCLTAIPIAYRCNNVNDDIEEVRS